MHQWFHIEKKNKYMSFSAWYASEKKMARDWINNLVILLLEKQVTLSTLVMPWKFK